MGQHIIAFFIETGWKRANFQVLLAKITYVRCPYESPGQIIFSDAQLTAILLPDHPSIFKTSFDILRAVNNLGQFLMVRSTTPGFSPRTQCRHKYCGGGNRLAIDLT